MNFNGKNILIIGASSGIGEALARKFSANECNLILLARRKDKLEEIAGSLEAKSAKISIYKCDVSNKEGVKNVISEVKEKFGVLHLAIINSGVSSLNKFTEFDINKAEETININILGVINCLAELAPIFKNQGEGIIAGVSSLADTRGFAQSGVYCASKAAVTLLLESACIELSAFNVKVITIRPGFVKTPMTDKNNFEMPFLMSVEKAADIIAEGLRKEKRYIAFPLVMKLLVDFARVIPNFVFEYFGKRQYKGLIKG